MITHAFVGVQEEIIEVSRFYALTDLLKELSADVPGVTAFVRRKVKTIRIYA